MINWNELVEGHNRIYGSNYSNPDEMLLGLYKEKGCVPIATKLGVSPPTILSEIRKLGHPVRPKGGCNNVKGINRK